MIKIKLEEFAKLKDKYILITLYSIDGANTIAVRKSVVNKIKKQYGVYDVSQLYDNHAKWNDIYEELTKDAYEVEHLKVFTY